MSMFKELKTALADPKFLHALFEPALVWAVLISTLFYLVARFILKDGKAVVLSLILLSLSALLIWPVNRYREKSRPIGVYSTVALKNQDARRKDHTWVFYSLSGLAAAAIFLGRPDKGASGTVITIVTILGGLSAVTVAIWLQYKEAQIFYPDLQPKTVASADDPSSVFS